MIKDIILPCEIGKDETRSHVRRYLQSINGLSAQTVRTYSNALEEFLAYHASHKFEFTVADVHKYKRHLINKKKMRDNSVATYLTALRRFMAFLVAGGALTKNPAKRVSYTIKNRETRFDFLTFRQVEQLLSSINSDGLAGARDHALLSAMLYCALSEEEITRARISDFQKNGQKFYFTLPGKFPKDKPENVTVPKNVADSLRHFIRLRKEPFASAPLFVSYSNRSGEKPVTMRGVRDIIIRRLRTSGMLNEDEVKLTPFTIRHTAAIIYSLAHRNEQALMKRLDIKPGVTLQKIFDSQKRF